MRNILLKYSQIMTQAIVLILVGIVPILIAMSVLGLWHWDLSIPLVYSGSDDVWQLILTKILKDTGWILETPFLGAPDVAHWQYHAAAQTSPFHSAIMLFLSLFIDDAVRIQQIYYILNFSLISLTSYIACRLIKISKFAAVSIAILYSFTSFRIGWMFYAFLANYSAVPLSLVPVFWILTGQLQYSSPPDKSKFSGISQLFRSSKFWISLVCVLFVTLSDGYYAFFTLLLLGFATAMRICYGDIKAPIRLLAPVILIITLISVATVISLPLSSYKHAHPEEFNINGKPDPLLIKHPAEAEVYSSSLKLLLTPIPEHHIRKLGEIGQKIIDTSDGARKYPIGKPIVALGTIGGLLFLSSLLLVAIIILQQCTNKNGQSKLPYFISNNQILWAAVLLSAFIFLCSIAGGIGSLVALVFPTIRGYDRFPLFMLFCLFVAAGSAATCLAKNAGTKKLIALIGVTTAITFIGLYDQIPYNAVKCDAKIREKFLAERRFVKNIQKNLNAGAMVYQYPHSQYLSNSKYYGWGSFAHIRMYLHSTGLRWSNGASKNSAVENWHERISDLPISDLITEVEAVGFRGFVIDCNVVPENEYQKLQKALIDSGLKASVDAESGLAFVKLNDPGYRIVYNKDFSEVDKLVITDKVRISESKLSGLIEKPMIEKLLSEKRSAKFPITIERRDYPEIFNSFKYLAMGFGEEAIKPIDIMKGQMSCKIESPTSTASKNDTVLLTIKNKSKFDWHLGHGKYPIQIGLHLRKLDGTLLRWDDGFRVALDACIERNNEVEFRLPLSKLDLRTGIKRNSKILVEFELVQDGHAWFSQISSRLMVKTF